MTTDVLLRLKPELALTLSTVRIMQAVLMSDTDLLSGR